jgi:two-component system, OmpR family, sensor histidine kinase BaeS
VRRYDSQSWAARLGSLGFGAMFALVVALFVAPLIATPVDRLIRTVRARDSGQRDVRVGRIRSFRDIHELTTSYDELADHLDQQEQLRRDFVADISHELRTPIAVLRAGTEAMLDNVAEPTTGQLASLNHEAARLGTIVDDLQRLASAEAAAVQLRFGQCDVADLAASAADSLGNVFDQAGVRLERRLSSVHALCDWQRMREVVTNLLTNAVKFTPAGGVVVLETASSGGKAILRVSDSGVGIPPDELPHVAERFYRGSGAAQISGSGIGLAVVAELVRGHHGKLDIASEPGNGTKVTVEIP